MLKDLKDGLSGRKELPPGHRFAGFCLVAAGLLQMSIGAIVLVAQAS